jgi:hypothetical protein
MKAEHVLYFGLKDNLAESALAGRAAKSISIAGSSIAISRMFRVIFAR